MTFSFVHITDHHVLDSEATLLRGFSPAFAFRAVMRHIAGTVASAADFIVSTGDLVDAASDAAYRTVSQMLNLQGEAPNAPGPLLVSLEGLQEFPLYCLPGNHDDRQHFYQGLFPKTTPAPLMNAAFVHAGVQFVCLDWGPTTKPTVQAETLDFLARSLQTDSPSVILMHHQVVPVGSRWMDSLIADEVDRFWEVAAGRNVLGIFCGHVHTTYERVVEGIPVFGLRSTAFPYALQDEPLLCLLPPQYRFVTIHNNVLTTRVFEVPL